MNKVYSNIKYKIRYQFSWIAGYIGFFLAFMFVIYFILIKTDLVNEDTGSLSYRLWVLVLLQFSFSMRFKEDFNFFLCLSSTRSQIMRTLAGHALIYSGLMSILILLERILIDSVNNALGLIRVKDLFHYFAPYYNNNPLLQFIYFFTLCTSASALGLLIGSLFYRFGKKFTLAFWLVLASFPTLFFPLSLLLFNGGRHIPGAIITLGEFLQNFNIHRASLHSLIFTVVFGSAAWLNIRKLPQK